MTSGCDEGASKRLKQSLTISCFGSVSVIERAGTAERSVRVRADVAMAPSRSFVAT